jgi:hypothetical protein
MYVVDVVTQIRLCQLASKLKMEASFAIQRAVWLHVATPNLQRYQYKLIVLLQIHNLNVNNCTNIHSSSSLFETVDWVSSWYRKSHCANMSTSRTTSALTSSVMRFSHRQVSAAMRPAEPLLQHDACSHQSECAL